VKNPFILVVTILGIFVILEILCLRIQFDIARDHKLDLLPLLNKPGLEALHGEDQLEVFLEVVDQERVLE